ncbi:hypothetical protein [Glycomyces tenuis]|uniref:hypothetical protein n=1 Tax=Glycomyces tenuis TaxID=58116 RepID=UPI00040EBCD8|nr:hypothetical protein [Glycomyces tenuis]
MPARHGVSNLGLALIAVLIAVAAVLTWSPIQRPAAEQAVLSFLEDVHAGDVDAALERIADAPAGPFLTPEALNADWEIVEVAQVGYEHGEDGTGTARVYAEIRAGDDTRLAHRYEVVFESGEPRITDRLTGGQSYSGGIVEVNDVLGPAQEVYLLPGVYHFYGSTQPAIDMNMPSMLVLGDRFVELGGEHATGRPVAPRPELTAESEAAFTEALHEYLDACAVTREHCSFGHVPSEHPFVEADPSEPWRIIEYPKVMLEGWLLAGGLRLRTVEPGVVEFDAVPEDSGGDAEPVALTCPLWAENLILAVDWETGDFAIEQEIVGSNTCHWLTG